MNQNIRYSIDHKTYYQYVAPVVQSHHVLHLTPRIVPYQIIHSHSLMIEPAPAYRRDYLDYHGNPETIVIIEAEHAHIQFHTHTEIELIGPSSLPPETSPAWTEIQTEVQESTDLDILKFTTKSTHTKINDEIWSYAKKSFPAKRPVHEAALNLMERIYKEFTFDNTATDVSTPIIELFKMKRGVCQDFAHLAIACVRAMGLPACYVSGYLLTKPPEGQKKLAGSDATHAWLSVWCGKDIGWLDLDPTNNVIPSGDHITFAIGSDFEDVSPISGVLIGGGDHSVTVGVDVIPMEYAGEEAPI